MAAAIKPIVGTLKRRIILDITTGKFAQRLGHCLHG